MRKWMACIFCDQTGQAILGLGQLSLAGVDPDQRKGWFRRVRVEGSSPLECGHGLIPLQASLIQVTLGQIGHKSVGPRFTNP